jgi:uncharacterized protein YyaL (SSP411 family)
MQIFSARRPQVLAALALSASSVTAGASTCRADYRAKAEEATAWTQREMWDANAKLYRPRLPADPKALPFEFMWGNGVQFSALVGAAHRDAATYRPAMHAFAEGLEKYWDKDAAVPGFDAYFASRDGDDKYYDDNAWLALSFAEAFRNTRDPKFLDWSKRTHAFVLSGWDDKLGGGIYWYQNKKDSKNTCVNAPAAVTALALHALGEPGQLEWAQHLVAWTRQNLQDTDGLYWDNINLDGRIEKTKWTYNTALMIRAHVGLWRATKDPKYLLEARREADASIVRWANPTTGGFANDARFNHLLSEALLETFEATKDAKYLNAVRRDADFAFRYVRDVREGKFNGYWTRWRKGNRDPNEAKILIENASAARLFWLLAPYSDVDELWAQAEAEAKKKNFARSTELMRQALASTSEVVAPSAKP